MKRQIAAAVLLLAALGIASQAQAQGWDADRPHWGNDRHYERHAHRGWNEDRRYREPWRDPWRDYRRQAWHDGYGGHNGYGWHDGDGWRHWPAARERDDDWRYRRPHYRYYDDDYNYYHRDDDCDDSDISLLISLPLQF